MNILVVSINEWSDENSLGNTLSNWFSSWEDVTISNIFMREGNPTTRVCNRYFRISDKMLVKNFLHPSKIGYEFTLEDIKAKEDTKNVKNERKLINIIHKHNFRFMYYLQDLLWSFKSWQNDKLDQFIIDTKPDVVFFFAMPILQYIYTLEHIKKLCDCKIVAYIPDNVYPKFFHYKKIDYKVTNKRFEKLMSYTDKIYAASNELAKNYSQSLNREISSLYKGASFEKKVKEYVNSPLRITYAGNLIFGRLDTVMALAKAIDEINKAEIRIVFDIYSGTEISESIMQELKEMKGTNFNGKVEYQKVKTILNATDLVLLLESFYPKEIDKVKFSFSTKIIDCLQSGNTLMAIGPKNISSIEYARSIPGAIVIDDLQFIKKNLENILASPKILVDNAKKIRDFAIENHEIKHVQNRLQNDFNKLIIK